MQAVLQPAAGSWVAAAAAPRQPERPAASAPPSTFAAAVIPRHRLTPLRAASSAHQRQHWWQQQRHRLRPLASSAADEPLGLALSSQSGEVQLGGTEASPGHVCCQLYSTHATHLFHICTHCCLTRFTAGDEGASLGSTASGGSDSYAQGSGSSGSDAEGGGGGVQIDLQLPRRSLLVQFTCNKCQGRSERLVNPVAWHKGMVSSNTGH